MQAHPLLDPGFPLSRYCPVDLSVTNPDLGDALKDPESCQQYLGRVLERNAGEVAYGGYLERRALYEGFSHFNESTSGRREYHLGLDLWAPAGTSVHAPLEGRVHSWANRTTPGDYGPVLVLEHEVGGQAIYSLYGHLAASSLEGLCEGRHFLAGERIGSLGTPQENGGYAPHLHFQLIRDLEGKQGDYPGVCSGDTLAFYAQNCPDPLVFLDYGL
jgi:murein DD-endopeptidase MepM/ murein hydrolase activator NlpD